jgi:hypothetical protein
MVEPVRQDSSLPSGSSLALRPAPSSQAGARLIAPPPSTPRRLMCHPIVDSGSAELGRDLAGAVVPGDELGHLGRSRGAGGTVSSRS